MMFFDLLKLKANLYGGQVSTGTYLAVVAKLQNSPHVKHNTMAKNPALSYSVTTGN